MSAFDKARLKKKYGWSGKKYNELMSKVLTENYQKIGERVVEQDKRRFDANLKSMSPKTSGGKKIVLPDTSNIIRRSTTIIKGAERGKLMTKTLREKIRKDVKAVLLEEGITTTRGNVPKRLSQKMEARLNETYREYTSRNKKYGMPTNIHTIAVTETRSVVNNIRLEYTKKVAASVPGRRAVKKWVHNRSMSNTPRDSHQRMERHAPVDVNQKFKLVTGGRVWMVDGPHDPTLPPDEMIACNCELSFEFIPQSDD